MLSFELEFKTLDFHIESYWFAASCLTAFFFIQSMQSY
jgi:hypothetical protein